MNFKFTQLKFEISNKYYNKYINNVILLVKFRENTVVSMNNIYGHSLDLTSSINQIFFFIDRC